MQQLFVTLLAFVAPTTTQESASRPAPEIVVTGKRLSDTQNALDACVARKCPPKEDIAATLAHAENLFVAGRYENAQTVAAAGIRRNRSHAAELPREVAGLFRAHARLSAHLGESHLERSSTADMVAALRAGLNDKDPDVLVGRIELADVYAKQEDVNIAENNYRAVEKAALETSDRRIEGYARFRRGMLLAALSKPDYMYIVRARQVLRELAASTTPEHAVFAQAATVGLKRLELRNASPERLAALLVAAQGGTPTARPVLLYGEPVDLDNARSGLVAGDDAPVRSVTASMSTDLVNDQWIDIAFYIDAMGRPQEIETIRTSERYSGGWADRVIKAIGTRRYAPLTLVDGQPGIFRVERYTKTATLEQQTSSRIAQRSPYSRIEMTDLSVEQATTGNGSTNTPRPAV